MSEENYLERMDRQLAEEQRFNRHIRGEIINAAVAVESSIEEIIAEHFCEPASKALFISLVFVVGQVTFSQKILILKKLFKDSYPDFVTTFPRLFNGLEKLRELRNKLAHSKKGFPKGPDARAYMMGEIESLPKGVYLEYYKDGEVKQEFISEESFNKTVKLGYFYQSVLSYIEMEVKNRRRKSNNINFRLALRTLRKDRPDLVKWSVSE
jgi:hypothetical protein